MLRGNIVCNPIRSFSLLLLSCQTCCICLRYLCQYNFKRETHLHMMKLIRKLLIHREGLLPPSESTYTVHELVHVVDQVLQLGPPIMSSMFKFEPKNRWMKGLLKNQYPLASVIKNYLISESCSFLVSLNYETYSRIQNLFEFANSKFKSKISRSMRTILNLTQSDKRSLVCNRICLSRMILMSMN
jgi:hypothetical protein